MAKTLEEHYGYLSDSVKLAKYQAAVDRVVRQTVTDAGFADKAEFIQANSFELTLPEQVDVVICDHVGYFGFDYGLLDLLTDAKQRFLKPDGIDAHFLLIILQLTLMLATINSANCK